MAFSIVTLRAIKDGQGHLTPVAQVTDLVRQMLNGATED